MKVRNLVALLALATMVLAACGGGTTATTQPSGEGSATTGDDDIGDETSEWGLPLIDPLDVDPGVDIGIAGSSTVFPLSEAVLARWIDEGGPEYSIDSIGSGGGLERFCVEGASDVANASRQINDEEVAACTDTWGTPPI